MKPKHFHLIVALILGIASIGMAFYESYGAAAITCIGSLSAILHWKASKLGVTD